MGFKDITDALKKRAVDVPEWGFAVTVRELKAGERTQVLEMHMDARRKCDTPAQMVFYCVTDDEGKPFAKLSDVHALSAEVVDRLARVVGELSGLVHEEDEKKD